MHDFYLSQSLLQSAPPLIIPLLLLCQVLAAMKKRSTSSSYPNVKSLTMRHHFDDYKQFVGLLGTFPRLNRLVLRDNKRHFNQNESLNAEAKSYPKLEVNLPESFMVQLRTIDVTWSQDNNIFHL